MENILNIKNKKEFSNWLEANYKDKKECYVVNLLRGKPKDDNNIYYLDLLEIALCYGWIDSKYKKIDGVLYQRFSPRKKNSNWTVLNIARVKRLQSLGLVKKEALTYLPSKKYEFDKEVLEDIKKSGIYDIFISFPLLYQQIKVSNLSSIKKQSIESYKKSLANLVRKTKENKLVGEWNDYGRLEGISVD